MKNNKKIILGIVIAIVVIGGVFVYLKNLPTDRNTDPDNVLGSTADWKTYTDNKYGYEIKYPLNWQIDQLDQNLTGIDEMTDDTGIFNPTHQGKEAVIIGSFLSVGSGICDSPIWKSNSQKINNKTLCFFGKNNIKLDMRAVDEHGKNIEDQILSTFKFTNTKVSNNTTLK